MRKRHEKESRIYRVRFENEPTGETKKDFYFGSIAAIYDRFTAEDIGCSASRLYNIGLKDGVIYSKEGRCTVSREELGRKKRRNAACGSQTSEDGKL